MVRHFHVRHFQRPHEYTGLSGGRTMRTISWPERGTRARTKPRTSDRYAMAAEAAST